MHHYFGNKERLLAEAITLPISPETVLDGVGADPDRLGPEIARRIILVWETQPEVRERMLAMLRSGISHERAAGLLRDLLGRTMLRGLGDLAAPGLPRAPHLTRGHPARRADARALRPARARRGRRDARAAHRGGGSCPAALLEGRPWVLCCRPAVMPRGLVSRLSRGLVSEGAGPGASSGTTTRAPRGAASHPDCAPWTEARLAINRSAIFHGRWDIALGDGAAEFAKVCTALGLT